MSYAKQLGVDKNRVPLQEFPAPFPALQRYGSENGLASSVISLTHDTTILEIAAVGGAAAMKWIGTGNTNPSVISAVSGTNYDHVISSNTVRRFMVPKESSNLPAGSVVGINRQEGLYQRVAIKSVGVSSVLLSEY